MTYKSQTVSAVVITENNASTLEQALASLHWVDELIVFDRGSSDGTLAIARNHTKNVFFHPSRNLTTVRWDALSTAKSDWLLLVEPDEWVEEMLRHEIDGVMLNVPADVHGYKVPRHIKFQNQWFNTPVGDPNSHVLRLVRKKQWAVGEDWEATLSVDGKVGKLDRPLGYAPYPTVDALFSGVNGQSTLAAYRHLEANGTANGSIPSPFQVLIKSKLTGVLHFFLKGGLFKGMTGQTLAAAHTLHTFLTFAKVRALTKKV